MADSVILEDKQELPPNWTVQEMVLKGGNDLPERYINSTRNQQEDDDMAYMDAPFIDLDLLCSSSAQTKAQELEKLRSILSTWGCFQLVNHGMTSSFLDQMRDDMKKFFALPSEEKRKYSRKPDGIEGYGNDNNYAEHTVNWNDRLHLIVHPQDKRQLEYWPENPKTFSETLNEYTVKSRHIAQVLLKAMALSLNLTEDSFLKMYGEAENELMFARFNYYPPCPRPDLVFGIKAHTDGTAVTILLQDKQVEALQVCKDDKWFKVAAIPHALFINVGDQMEMISNGIFKSAYHRVTTNIHNERISLAMLCSPDPEYEIEAPSALVSKERPRLFKKFKHYGQYYFQVDPTDARRPIDLLKIQ